MHTIFSDGSSNIEDRSTSDPYVVEAFTSLGDCVIDSAACQVNGVYRDITAPEDLRHPCTTCTSRTVARVWEGRRKRDAMKWVRLISWGISKKEFEIHKDPALTIKMHNLYRVLHNIYMIWGRHVSQLSAKLPHWAIDVCGVRVKSSF